MHAALTCPIPSHLPSHGPSRGGIHPCTGHNAWSDPREACTICHIMSSKALLLQQMPMSRVR